MTLDARTFSRLSLTPIHHSRSHETEKRHGAGKANWGNEGDEAKAAATDDAPKAEGEEAKEETEAPAEVAAPEPEEKQLSYEEYEAALAAKKAALNKKAVETKEIDMAEFKGMQTYVRKATEEKVTGVEISAAKKKAEPAAEKAEKTEEKKKPIVLETNFKIAEASDSGAGAGGGRGGGRGGERGGRGGDRGSGRGGGGRGGDRPASSREGGRGGERPSRGGRGAGRGGAGPSAGPSPSAAGPSSGARRAGPGVNIADENAFPSLN